MLGIIGGIGLGVIFVIVSSIKSPTGLSGLFQDKTSRSESIVIGLAACLIKADGVKDSMEKRYVDLVLEKNFDPEKAKELKEKFRETLKTEVDFNRLCANINNEYTAGSKIQLIQFLCAVATCDSFLNDAEYRFILKTSQKLGVPFASFRSILGMFNYRTQKDREDHKRNFNEKKKVYKSSSSLKQAYELLEIPENVSDKEVKKAYRKMAKEHHPDRVLNMGVEFQKMAKERFQKIQKAYELIKDKRGFA